MKKNLLFLIAGAFSFVILTGYSNGTAYVGNINCTGSYGSQDNCTGSNCHAANTGDVNITLLIRNLNGDTIEDFRYFPGAYYDIIISGSVFPSSASFPKYSFQFSGQSDYSNGGTFTPTTGLHETVVGSAKIVEPTTPFNTTTGNKFQSTIYYQAPSGGNPTPGKWRLHATVLGANFDNSPSNDKANNTMVEFSPIPLSVGSIDEKVAVTLFPNPVKDELNIKIENADAGDYLMGIYNIKGQIVKKEQLAVSGNSFTTRLSTADWPSGAYTMELLKDGKRRIMHLIKQ